MKKFTFFILFFAVLYFFNIKDSYALKTVSIHILAEKVTYVKNNHSYIFTGKVVITRKKFTLKADKVVYFYKTDFAVATGNVILNSKGAITKARKLKVYLKNRIGTIYNSHIHYIDKSIYVYGKKNLS